MTEDTPRDPIADWHAQFAPRAPGAVEGEPRHDLVDQVAVEHFANEHGVFVAPAPAEAVQPAPEHVEGEVSAADAEHGA